MVDWDVDTIELQVKGTTAFKLRLMKQINKNEICILYRGRDFQIRLNIFLSGNCCYNGRYSMH